MMPGLWQVLICLAVVLLLFGHKLPGAMRSLGLGISEFKKGLGGDDEPQTKIEQEENKS